MVMLPDARTPEGMRIYAIGDIHGCLDPLVALHGAIAADLAQNPAEDWRVVHLGDLVDRGPDNAGVIRWLAARADDPRLVTLRGNHDDYLLWALADPEMPNFDRWMKNGGDRTLEDFGVPEVPRSGAGRAAAMARVAEGLTGAERDWLEGLSRQHRAGDYLLVHAGIRPGVALEAQDPHDLMWMREPFLSSEDDHGAVIVHGHTISETPVVRPNRIGIDTGAFAGGPLTCLILDGAGRWILGPAGRAPLPAM